MNHKFCEEKKSNNANHRFLVVYDDNFSIRPDFLSFFFVKFEPLTKTPIIVKFDEKN